MAVHKSAAEIRLSREFQSSIVLPRVRHPAPPRVGRTTQRISLPSRVVIGDHRLPLSHSRCGSQHGCGRQCRLSCDRNDSLGLPGRPALWNCGGLTFTHSPATVATVNVTTTLNKGTARANGIIGIIGTIRTRPQVVGGVYVVRNWLLCVGVRLVRILAIARKVP